MRLEIAAQIELEEVLVQEASVHLKN